VLIKKRKRVTGNFKLIFFLLKFPTNEYAHLALQLQELVLLLLELGLPHVVVELAKAKNDNIQKKQH
jgi:hypothetical protein